MLPSVKYIEREAQVRQAIDDELVVFDLAECKPLLRHDSRALAAQSTRKVAIAQQATVTITMKTEASEK